MTTENTALKGVADCMLRSRQIAINRHRHRVRARTGISSEIGLYLALNWQRPAAGVGHTSRARRFLTPQPPLRNERAVTTSDLFWANHRRKPPCCYRVGYKISIFNQVNGGRGGGGAAVREVAKRLDTKAHSEFSA
jgi:hypothetical protein